MSATTTIPIPGRLEFTDDADRPAHKCCRVCHPEVYPGVQALCGEELLGIPARPGQPECKTCLDVMPNHLLQHYLDRRD